MGGRSVVGKASYWIDVGVSKILSWKIRTALFNEDIPDTHQCSDSSGLSLLSTLPRKTPKHKIRETVPQTDTGGQVEKTKANG